MPHEASTVRGDQSVGELRRELAEAREQQAASSEILRVIGEARTDIQPVFDTIITSAVRLCGARMGAVFRFDGELVHFAAQYNYPPRAIENLRRMYPRRPQADQASGRAILARSVAQIEDLLADQFYHREQALAGDWRSVLAVPMLREGVPIGAIVIARREVGPFHEGYIELLKTFANQAVIAIENARLFDEVQARTKELQDSLDRQTVTSEVLGVISRSPNEVQPVLDMIVATAQRLCQAERAVVWRLEGEAFRAVAHHGTPEERVESLYSARMPLSRGTMLGRATLARRAVQVEDVATDLELNAATRALSRPGNVHTVLAVPLLLKGEPIGAITLQRTRVAPFDDKQVALVEAFADQAVIAIENTRLFEAEQASKRELQESLEHQTATSDVLNVISRSTTDVQPVFDAIVESAAKLFDPCIVNINSLEDAQLVYRAAASVGYELKIEAAKSFYPIPFDPERSAASRAILEQRIVEIPDAAAPDTPELTRKAQQALGNFRSVTLVPLIREGKGIGFISLAHPEPGFKQARFDVR